MRNFLCNYIFEWIHCIYKYVLLQEGNWNTVKVMHDENKLDLIVNDIFTERWAIGKSVVFILFFSHFIFFIYLYFEYTICQYCQL